MSSEVLRSTASQYLNMEIQRIKSVDGITRKERVLNYLQQQGILKNDPRITKFLGETDGSDPNSSIDIADFLSKINSIFILKLLSNELVITNFPHFTGHISHIFNTIKNKEVKGHVCQQTPESASKDPNLWGLSLCTVDGQRFSIGDSDEEFCLQAVSQPFTYAIGLTNLGAEEVHKYVGYEPSGQTQDTKEHPLNAENKPHNPLTNAGALVTTALLGRDSHNAGECFKKTLEIYGKLAGGSKIHFDNCEYQSKKVKNYDKWSLLYKLLDKDALPAGLRHEEVMDLYLQMCAISMNCEAASIMAATLANGGICPISNDRVLSNDAVRDTLSVMLSCGQYQHSGHFAFTVGLPSKTGISGIILLVVPNVMGMCLFSPALDHNNISTRSLEFCNQLVDKFSLHIYESVVQNKTKIDPINRVDQNFRFKAVAAMLYASFHGNINTLQKYLLQGYDLDSCDYDRRTPLHIAAAEGKLEAVQFLCEVARVNHLLQDRWGSTAKDSAKQGNHTKVVQYLDKVEKKAEEEKTKVENVNPKAPIQQSQSIMEGKKVHVDLSIPKTLLGDYVVTNNSANNELKTVELACPDDSCNFKTQAQPLETLGMLLEGVEING